MIVLHDRDSLLAFAEYDIPAGAREHVARHVSVAIENDDLLDLTCLAVIVADDTKAEIEAALGFNPLVHPIDGTRCGDPGFLPYWDWLQDHGGWYEMIVTVGNDGFAYVLLVEGGSPLAGELNRYLRPR